MQQKLNKIMKISQEDVILIKKYLSFEAVLCTKALEWIARQELETWWHWQFAEQKPQDGYKMSRNQAAVNRVCRVGPCAPESWQAKKASVSSLDFAWNCHSLFKCIQENNSPWSPAHMLQTMSCSAVVWSQSYLPSHSLINNVIACNKSFLLFYYKP